MDKIKTLDLNSDIIKKASAKIRSFLDEIIDENSLVETDVFLAGRNFLDGTEALGEGVITGYAAINDNPVYLFAQNSEVLSGGLSKAQADKITKNIYSAEKAGVPFISIIDSAGARIGEGISVGEGYSKIIKAANDISGCVPHIAIVKGNAVGMMSVYLKLADFVFAAEDAKLSVNSPVVVAAASKAKPEAMSAKAISENTNNISCLYKTNAELKEKLAELLELLPSNDGYIAAGDYSDDINREAPELNENASAESLFTSVADGGKYFEVYKDFAKEVKCALAKVAGITTAFIAFDKNANKFITLNGIKKASRFIYTVSSFNIPQINFVDNKGIEPSLSDEYNGLAESASELMTNVALSENVKISVITGNAIGYAYSAFASKNIGYDYTFATVDAVISPVNPEVATVLLYDEELKKSAEPVKKREELNKKYAEESANPYIAAKGGYVDNIIEPSLIRPYVISVLLMLVNA
ncbi:MAG: hypothetical protein LBQ27_03565 [Clostridiales bacterium]|jgi:propionyl-CoA carboxylase beta chain|nr:hypothetical protein [Clostridiales bacterium]